MASTGSPIADDLVNKFTFKKQRDEISNAASNAMDTVKKKVSSILPSNKDTSTYTYDQNAVNKANNTPKAAPAKPAGKMPSYKDGTARVPKTGPAKLHKDEMVLDKKTADKVRDGAASELGGESKPAKVIDHIKVRKAKVGGKHVNIHTHVHTHPQHHPDETHVTEGNDGLVDHMMEHQGEPNPGEAEADAGQSGVEPTQQAGPVMGGM